jgi:hypothetical protein
LSQVEAPVIDQLPFGADALEGHDKLELEEDDGIDGGPAPLGIPLKHPLPEEVEIASRLEDAVDDVGEIDPLRTCDLRFGSSFS